MASWNSVNFEEAGGQNGAFLPVHGSEVGTTIIPVPGGPKVYLQVGQPRPVSFSLPARVTAAQRDSLRLKVNTSGTLVYAGGSVTATLEEVVEPKEIKTPNDMYFMTLNFKI